jgi:phosphoglycolate phosphatase-like HAD superfamily hydrolase
MATVILDLDGPLLDGRYRHHACYQQILLEQGYVPLALEEYWKMKCRRQDRRMQLAASGAEAIYDTFLQLWQERIETLPLLALDRLQAGAVEKLASWKLQGIRLVLATQRHNPATLAQQLADFGLDRFFDPVIVCDHAEGGTGKARRVRDNLADCADERRLWIGDTEVDIEAARALGCPIWAVCCGIRTEAYLQSLSPDFISWSVADVDLEGVWA